MQVFLSWRMKASRRRLKAWHAGLMHLSTGCSGRVLPCVRHFFPDNSHRYSSHPADDFSLRRVVKSPNILVGVRVGNYDQLTPIHLAPTANVTFSEFHEIDGTVKFCFPFLSSELSLACINLHERTRADKRVKRIVLKPDIAIH